MDNNPPPGKIVPLPSSEESESLFVRIHHDPLTGEHIWIDSKTGERLPRPKPPLKSLEEFNQRRRTMYRTAFGPTPNGIACPECGKELMDTDTSFTTASNPPQKYVHCPSCQWKGYRIA